MFSEYKLINKKTFILSIGIAFLILVGMLLYQRWYVNQPFTFGVIADCQYCNDPGSGVRKYASSKNKLKQCVDHLNTMDLEYVVHLGDFIDREIESFDVVIPIFNQLKIAKYHVLGNHDFSVADTYKNRVPQVMGLESRYYDFEVNGWRFVVLDGNDISFHAYPDGSDHYNFASRYYKENSIQSPKWNGAIGANQLNWLKEVLDIASVEDQKVIIYCHFPIFPENPHNLWNANEVLELLEQYHCVKAYMNGHNHAGNYATKAGIHYVTFKGMVDTYETSFATVHVNADSIKINGFGREENRILELR